MKNTWTFAVFAVAAMASIVMPSRTLWAADWSWLNAARLWKGTPVDVHLPECDKQCGHEGCIERVPVTESMPGEKQNHKLHIRYEYLSVPETRYRWQIKRITKEIPCDACTPVCKEEDAEHPFAVESWDKQPLDCGHLHCKTCVPQTEKVPVKRCEVVQGKTTIKVHYWSCVKVPYTVYRQVKQEVCVKRPCNQKVNVNVTRYVCKHCGGLGCKLCKP
jgi:hypothetical protein